LSCGASATSHFATDRISIDSSNSIGIDARSAIPAPRILEPLLIVALHSDRLPPIRWPGISFGKRDSPQALPACESAAPRRRRATRLDGFRRASGSTGSPRRRKASESKPPAFVCPFPARSFDGLIPRVHRKAERAQVNGHERAAVPSSAAP